MFDDLEDIDIDEFIDTVQQGDTCPVCLSTIEKFTTYVPFGDTEAEMTTLYCPGCGII